MKEFREFLEYIVKGKVYDEHPDGFNNEEMGRDVWPARMEAIESMASDILKKWNTRPSDPVRVENRKLRELLWLFHNRTHTLYGDDGEMQCSACWIDFKRDSVESIYAKLLPPMPPAPEEG
jgi:hypothetical protein